MKKKIGRPKKRNPIGEHLQMLVETKGISREQMAVAADVSFLTLMNVFNRDKVSDRIRMKLKAVNLINDEVLMEYKRWCHAKGLNLR